MKKIFMVTTALLISIICSAKTLNTKIEYYLVEIEVNQDFEGCEYTIMDSIKFQDLKYSLDTDEHFYKLGSTIFSGDNGSSYHRVFSHKTFGYFELLAKYKKDMKKINSSSIIANFSSSPDSNAIDQEGQKIIYNKDTYSKSCLHIDSELKLLVLISPSKDDDDKLESQQTFLQDWIKKIAIKHQLDSLQTKHIPSDPAVIAFCSSSNINNTSATIKNATFLINEADTYLLVKADKAKQEANNPLTWIRGWDECEILLNNGIVERFSFADSELKSLNRWDKQGEVIETNDSVGARIVITLNK
jgi:hypothetical protein